MDLKSYTNHYLFYAQTLINLSLSPSNKVSQNTVNSLLTSACLNIVSAWNGCLKELGECYKQGAQPVDVLDKAQAHLPEAQRLHDLMKLRGSWLYEIKLIEQNPIEWLEARQSEGDSSSSSDASHNAIQIIAVAASETDTIQDQLLRIVSEFKQYLNELREQQTQW